MANASEGGARQLVKLREFSTQLAQRLKEAPDLPTEPTRLALRVGSENFLVEMGLAGEIVPLADIAPVPWTKPWYRGLANVRGELLTVVDLARFLTGVRTPVTARTRLLATSLNKAPIGLLIDEVFGQRHFLASDSVPAQLPEGSALSGIVSKQYNLGSETWQELNLDQLFNSTEFLNGAAE